MIIVINGAASSGKSSIIRELQRRAPYPLLKTGIDVFLGMMPASYYGRGSHAHEGIEFAQEQTPEGPITRIKNGPFGRSFLHAVPKTIAFMAQQNLNIACDEVFFYDYYLAQYTKAFKGLKAYFIGVHCSLPELIRRENKRGGMCVGLGRDQINRVHGPTRYYDLEVDTTRTRSTQCAEDILAYIQKTPHPTAFQKLEKIFFPE